MEPVVHTSGKAAGDDSIKISAATNRFGASERQPGALGAGLATQLGRAHLVPTLFINSSVARMHAGRNDHRISCKTISIREVAEFENFATTSVCLILVSAEPLQPSMPFENGFIHD